MTNPSQTARLAQLLHEAASAHHRAYSETGGSDPDWAVWYARFLAPEMAELGWEVGVSDLTQRLQELDERYRAEGSSGPWPEYYAERLIGMLSAR